MIYGVQLALIAPAAWASFDSASRVAQQEANLAGNLYRHSVALGEPQRTPIRQALGEYLDVVVDHQWPAQRAPRHPRRGWR